MVDFSDTRFGFRPRVADERDDLDDSLRERERDREALRPLSDRPPVGLREPGDRDRDRCRDVLEGDLAAADI